MLPGATYTYSVTAYDAAGNPSPPSETVTVTVPAVATTLFFAPAADTYVRADSPTSNYGADTKLAVDNSPVKHLLLKFNISGIGVRTVVSAKLRLHNVDDPSVGGLFYRGLDTSWGETTVNWNTAPAAEGAPAASLGTVTRQHVRGGSDVARQRRRGVQPQSRVHIQQRSRLHIQGGCRRARPPARGHPAAVGAPTVLYASNRSAASRRPEEGGRGASENAREKRGWRR